MSTRLVYLGFEAVLTGRDYNFRVAAAGDEDRFFTVTISNQDFVSGRLKYQEGPDISYRKMVSTLSAEEGGPVTPPRQQLTETEVTDYMVATRPKAKWTPQERLAAGERLRARLAH